MGEVQRRSQRANFSGTALLAPKSLVPVGHKNSSHGETERQAKKACRERKDTTCTTS
jgi:hypothetical protein